MDGLRAVNVYAITDDEGVDLIDAGMALVPAREQLTAALRQIGYELGDIRNFFVTHIHIDHYSLAVELRQDLPQRGLAGRGGAREPDRHQGDGRNADRATVLRRDDLRRLGAPELAAELPPLDRHGPASSTGRTRTAGWPTGPTSTCGRGRSARFTPPVTPAATWSSTTQRPQIMFAGDHVLPHITPSIGFESAGNRMALRDYLSSLARTLALPDARLLPAHGPVTGSTHERVNELLAHHDVRLAEIHQAVLAGHATAYEVAKAIKWTRRQRLFGDLDLFSQVHAVNETAAHLEVLAVRGQLTREVSADGADTYQAARSRASPWSRLAGVGRQPVRGRHPRASRAWTADAGPGGRSGPAHDREAS